MESLVKKFFRSSIISSVVLIALGLLLIFQSEATIISIAYIIGGILVAIGALALIKYVKGTNKANKNELDIVYGIVTIILGILVIQNPEAIASIIPIVLGISIIINSANKLQYAFELKANENRLWKTTMVIAIISTLCGIVLLFNPFKGAVMFTKLVGIFIVVYAILDMISTITIKRNVTILHNAIEGNIDDAEIIEEKEVTEEPVEVNKEEIDSTDTKEKKKKPSKKKKKTSKKSEE